MANTLTLNAKPLGEMIPGELIRFPIRGAMVLGMVAACDHIGISSGLMIILLENIPDRPQTVRQILGIDELMETKIGLSYGRQHIVVVHPSTPVAGSSDRCFRDDGVLLVAAGATALRTRYAMDAFNEIMLTIDIESWTSVRNVPPNSPPWRIAVLAWEIRLLSGVSIDPLLPPVFAFRAGD